MHRLSQVKESPTLAVAAKANKLKQSGVNIIDFSVGEPDFAPPKFITDAIVSSLNLNKYTAVDGIIPLRNAISKYIEKEYSLEYPASQITTTNGAKQAIYNGFMASLDVSDEVIIPAPYWVSYPEIVRLSGGTPVIVSPSSGLKVSGNDIKSAITKNTKWIILNSPNNPTGAVYSREEYSDIASVLREYPNIWILLDDIYAKVSYVKFESFISVFPEFADRTLVVNGLSKSHAMTGWRFGYAFGPDSLIKKMSIIQSHSTSNVCHIIQMAALAAIQNSDEFLNDYREEYKRRRDFMLQSLLNIGFECEKPDGAFYIFANANNICNRLNLNDIQLSEYLLEKASVAVVPGSAFGFDNYIRFSYATSMENIKIGMESMKLLGM
jgi:aspartate aminotransferase